MKSPFALTALAAAGIAALAPASMGHSTAAPTTKVEPATKAVQSPSPGNYIAPIVGARPHAVPPPPIPYDEIMPLRKIHRGMKGYGLTVFHGTKIERFGVEVIDILSKQYLGHDLILIRMNGGPITKRGANIIAGMSGSPVYFDGKLAGAISMGYEWPKEPVAMVTPIEYMEDAFNPRLPSEPLFSSTPWSQQPLDFASTGFDGSIPNALNPADDVPGGYHTASTWEARFAQAASALGMASGYNAGTMPGQGGGTTLGSGGLHPLMTPIFASGLSPEIADRLNRVVSPFGLQVAAGLGPGASTHTADHTSLQPGSMVGIFFCTGDIELGGYGTVTYRKGNRILAFGHPLEQLGPIDFPMSTSYVADIFSSYNRSEKMCQGGKIVGTLAQDRPWSVMGVIGKKSHMVPLTVAVNDEQTGKSKTYHIQCVNHPLWTGMVADVAAQQAVHEIRTYPGDSMADVRVEVDPVGLNPIVRTNTYFDYFNPQGMGLPSLSDMDRILDMLQSNPFRAVDLKAIKVWIQIRPGRKMAAIERIAVDKTQVTPGEMVHVDVTMRPWKGQPIITPMDVQIPADAPNGTATLMVTGGMMSPMPSAPSAGGGITIILGGARGPRGSAEPAPNLEAMIDRYLKTEKNDDLVGRVVQAVSPSLNVGGERLYNLPPAISSALHSPRVTGAFALPDESKTVRHMDSIILGGQGVPINIQRRETGWSVPSPATSAGSAGVPVPVEVPAVPKNDTPPVKPAMVGLSSTMIGRSGQRGARTRWAAAEPGGNAVIVPPSGTPPAPPPTPGDHVTAPATDSTTATTASSSTADSTADGFTKKIQTWTLRTQSDFTGGRGDGVAVGSLGDLAISPKMDRLRTLDQDDLVWAARPDGHGGLLLGTGHNGRVYRLVANNQLTTALKVNELDIMALCTAADGTAYAGTAPRGYIYRIPAGATAAGTTPPAPFFKTGKNYVLCLAADAQGNVYAGTNGGSIFKVAPDGTGSVWYQSNESHICALDIAPNGDILAGTSPSGFVYRITPDKKASVIWDSSDTSISALLALPDGAVVAATAPKGLVVRIAAGQPDAVQLLKTDTSVHDMTASGKDLFVASGPAIYQVLPGDEYRKIQDEDEQELLCVSTIPGGDLLVGTGNIAKLYRLHTGADANVFRTAVKDASVVSRWGHIRWEGDLPAGSSVRFETRSGNNSIPDTSWSSWAPAVQAAGGLSIPSPHARYLQTRVILSPGANGESPVVRSTEITYLPDNRPPTLTVSSPAPGAVVHGKVDLSWSGQDPDNDALLYTLQYSDDGGATWKAPVVTAKDSKTPVTDLTASSYQWDTAGLKDGSYLLKVKVSDVRSNPDDPQDQTILTGPFRIVNTEPKLMIPDNSVTLLPDKSIRLTGMADGQGSDIVAVNFRIDDGAWFSAMADNGLFDAPTIPFKAHSQPLADGDHKIEVQAINSAGDKTTQVVPLHADGHAGPAVETTSGTGVVKSDTPAPVATAGTPATP